MVSASHALKPKAAVTDNITLRIMGSLSISLGGDYAAAWLTVKQI
uniref:Uncharacterized protein n=1 Tax=Aquisalinus luteolus TaxID=1566827 RepID=A0A8J3A6Z4_9PROT|nr:hypothetical protein GCM10011355_33560 [Aquisalinus luteolus]